MPKHTNTKVSPTEEPKADIGSPLIAPKLKGALGKVSLLSTGAPLNIIAVLANEAWYGDEVVTWENALSAEDAISLSATRAKRLGTKVRNGLRPDILQYIVSENLGYCSADNRCKMSSCPQCTRAAQRWLSNAIVDLAADTSDVGAISIIPTLPLVTTVTAEILKKTIETVRDQLVATGLVEWAVLGLDVSWNDHRAVAHDWPDCEPRFGWKPHIYGFVKATDRVALRKAVSAMFAPTVSVPVPYKGRYYDGSAYGASYALKGQFYRRNVYPNRLDGSPTVRDLDLTAALEIELMLALTELGLAGRIELIGLKTVQNSKTKEITLAVTSVTGV